LGKKIIKLTNKIRYKQGREKKVKAFGYKQKERNDQEYKMAGGAYDPCPTPAKIAVT
jgi:hypothetical protein